MRGKLMFLGGLAVGYVLGTREGRERYEQLIRSARKILDHPTVQEARGVVQAEATRLYSEGKEVVTDKLGHTKLGERLKSDSDSAANARPVGSTSQP
jgi:hypothetical protein